MVWRDDGFRGNAGIAAAADAAASFALRDSFTTLCTAPRSVGFGRAAAAAAAAADAFGSGMWVEPRRTCVGDDRGEWCAAVCVRRPGSEARPTAPCSCVLRPRSLRF